MTFDQRETPGPGNPGALTQSATQPNRQPKDSRPTQYERVMSVLVERGEVCGHKVFYGDMQIPRFGAHLHRAKKNGMVITRRPCDIHWHEGTAYLYRLEYVPAPPDGSPCPACGGRLACVSTCPSRRDPNALPGIGDV